MNSYNRTKQRTGRQTIDRPAGLDGKSRARISIATHLKKEVRCRIDIDALSPRLVRQSQTGFGGRKNSPIGTPAFRALAASTKPSSEVESDVFGAYNKGIRGGATVSATECMAAAIRLQINSGPRRSNVSLWGRGSVVSWCPKLPDRKRRSENFRQRGMLK